MNHYFNFDKQPTGDFTPEMRTMLRYNTHLKRNELEELLDPSYTAEIADEATRGTDSNQLQDEIRDLHTKYGTPFAAFLTLTDLDLSQPDEPGKLEQRFLDAYGSSFVSREQVAEFHIESTGWQEAIDQVVQVEGIPPDSLRWNHQAVNDLFTEGWDLVELHGPQTNFVHQFIR